MGAGARVPHGYRTGNATGPGRENCSNVRTALPCPGLGLGYGWRGHGPGRVQGNPPKIRHSLLKDLVCIHVCTVRTVRYHTYVQYRVSFYPGVILESWRVSVDDERGEYNLSPLSPDLSSYFICLFVFV